MFNRFRTSPSEYLETYVEKRGWKLAIGNSPKRILVASSIGGNALVSSVDSFLGAVLSQRGHQVSTLICQSDLPACEVAQDSQGEGNSSSVFYKSICSDCSKTGIAFWNKFPFGLLKYSDHVTDIEKEEIQSTVQNLSLQEIWNWSYETVKIGIQVQAGTIRFFSTSDLDSEDQTKVLKVARLYLKAALITVRVIEKVLTEFRPDVVVNHHGVYVPQGIIDDICRLRGVRVVVWGTSYRKGTFIFSHGETYHKTFLNEPTSDWDGIKWNEKKRSRILSYLAERRQGMGDWSWVTPERGGLQSLKAIELFRKLNLDSIKPTFCLLTNIGWDAQIFYGNSTFKNMREWLFTTIDWFLEHPDQQLIVRVHPHEIKAGNREFCGDLIRERYQKLPPNIALVDRDSPLSTYEIADICKALLIYGTKTGVELAPFGMPVIVAADGWIRNKGFSVDINSREHYLQVLNSLDHVSSLDDDQRELALKFAYHYFFRKMVGFKAFESSEGFPPRAKITSLKDLDSGFDQALDLVVDGIVEGTPFHFDEYDGESNAFS